MNAHPTLAARLAASLAFLCAAVLAACGPGVGGTGGGETGLDAFGAQAANVCSADFAAAIACTPSPAGTPAAAATRHFADGEPASRHLATIEGQGIVLEMRCSAQRFSGTWGSAPLLGLRYYGQVQGAGDLVRSASLIVQADGAGLWLLLQDADGRTLAGPLRLAPVAAPTTPAPC